MEAKELIKASELRIGNFFRFISTDSIEVVADIRTHGLKNHVINNVNINDVDPIPISEEWLLKFGFVSIGDSHQIMYNKKAITLYKQDRIFWCDILWDSLEVKYVHQLQNLFYALSGEELTFND